MLKKNWTGIDEGTLFDKLKAGGYVLEITDVEDVSSRSYINLVFDIAEGPNAGHFDDSWGRDNPWAHRFVRSYKPNCEGMFKAFLQRLQDSNPGFDIAVWERNCDERDFIGLKIGAVLQYEDYTNQYGEDKERLVVTNIYSVDYIRDGKYKVPERIDKRETRAQHDQAVAGSLGQHGIAFTPASSDDDLPF